MSAIRALSTSGTLADDDCLPLMTRKLDSEVFSDSFRRVLRVRLIRFIASSDYTIQKRRRRAVTGESKKALSSRSGPWGRGTNSRKPSKLALSDLQSMPFSKADCKHSRKSRMFKIEHCRNAVR